jgi:predicted nucleotidyltransferase
MSTQFIAQVADAARRVFADRGILVAYAFGSRIRGRARPESDLDIGYYLTGYRSGKALPLREELLLETDLSEALDVAVDLRNLAGAPLELRGRALEEGVRIHSCDDVARVDLEVYVLARYHDYKETFRRMHEVRLKRTADVGL